MSDTAERVRIDKWLWAARFFKTRSLATQAVEGGKVRWNGERTKPSRDLKVGDRVLVQLGEYEWDIEVRRLATQRGPATIARTLYEETEQSSARRTALLASRTVWQDPSSELQGRPTKRDRRTLERWQRK